MSNHNEALHPRAEAGRWTDKAQSAPETDLESATLRLSPEFLLPGDRVFLSDLVSHPSSETASVISVQPHPDKPLKFVVRLTDGLRIVAGHDETLRAERDEDAPTYDRNASYDDRLAVAHHTLTEADTLREIVEYEAEDDFMFAVVTHQNATGELIDCAAVHHSLWVRAAALRSENVASETVRRIRDAAVVDAADDMKRVADEGTNPGTASLLHQVRENEALAVAAALVLRGRGEI